MGRSLPTASQLILNQLAELKPIYAALRRSDQLALDELFVAARQHLAAAAYAAHALPMEIFLLAMLLEEHKEVQRLRTRVEALLAGRPLYGGEEGEDG